MDNPLFLDYNVNMQRDEMADNLELECLFSPTHSCSIVSIAQEMGIADENEEDVDEINNNALSESLGIIDLRSSWCAGNYPFFANANTIQFQTSNGDISSVYTFLLLATREKMNTQRIADGIDGTLLFERLSACILKNYFGEDSHVSVFGTGSGLSESFKDKLKRLLSDIGEKGYSLREDAIEPTQKDGGIDLYAFIPFKDGKKGQFIGFGQCKTGTSWSSVLGMMCPETFDLYLIPRFIFTPISIYMLSDTIPSQKWDKLSIQSKGFIFDRCRLMNWLPKQIDNGIMEEIKRWNEAVIARYK
ncbi:MAG: hypothetical protein IJ524_07795 [Bacteroidales bacterium]|nr:hypothetical protein [Bacteroidales bacterium]